MELLQLLHETRIGLHLRKHHAPNTKISITHPTQHKQHSHTHHDTNTRTTHPTHKHATHCPAPAPTIGRAICMRCRIASGPSPPPPVAIIHAMTVVVLRDLPAVCVGGGGYVYFCLSVYVWWLCARVCVHVHACMRVFLSLGERVTACLFVWWWRRMMRSSFCWLVISLSVFRAGGGGPPFVC